MPPLLSGDIQEASGLYDALSRVKDVDITCGVLRIACKDFIGLIGISSSECIVGAVTKDGNASKLTSSDAVDRMMAMRTGTFEYYEVPQKELTRLDQNLRLDITEVLSKRQSDNEADAEELPLDELTSSDQPESGSNGVEAVSDAPAEEPVGVSEEYTEAIVDEPSDAVVHSPETDAGSLQDSESGGESSEIEQNDAPTSAELTESEDTAGAKESIDSEPETNLAEPTESERSQPSYDPLEYSGDPEPPSAGRPTYDISELNAIGSKSQDSAAVAVPYDIAALNAIGTSASKGQSKPAFDVAELNAIAAKAETKSSSFDVSALDAIGVKDKPEENTVKPLGPRPSNNPRATGTLLAKFKEKKHDPESLLEPSPGVANEPTEQSTPASAFDPATDELSKNAAETVERIKKFRKPEAEIAAEAEKAQRLKFASGRKAKAADEPDSGEDTGGRIRPVAKETQPLKVKTAPKTVSPKVWIGVGAVAAVGILFFATRGAIAGYFVSSAEKSFNKHDLNGALSTLSPAFIFDPGNGHAHFLKGQILVAQGDKAKAFEEYDQALAAAPTDGEILRAHATLAWRMNKFKTLKADTNELITNDPTARNDGYLYGLRARAELGLGEYQSAIDDCTSALKLGQKTPWIYSRRGWALTLKGNPKAAMKDFATALAFPKQDQSTSETWVGKAQALQALGDNKGALTCFDTALKINDKIADTYSRRAALFVNMKMPDKALADYAKAVAVDPSFTSAHIGRSDVYGSMNKLDDALAELNSVPKKYETPDVLFAKARLLTRKNDCKQALALFKQGLALNDKNPNNYIDMAFCLAAMKMNKEAVAAVQKACDAQPNNSQFRALHGYYSEAAGQTVSAQNDYETALSLDPKNSDAHFRRGAIFESKGDASAAIQDYEAALATNPGNGEAKKRLAALTKVTRHSSATTTASNLDAIKIMPGDLKTLMDTGYAKMKSHDARAAVNYFASAVKLDPSNVQARRYLAYSLAMKGSSSDAISQFAALDSSGSAEPADLRMLGKLLVENLRAGEAVDVYMKLLLQNPKDTASRLNLANAYHRAGNFGQALTTLQDGAKLDPSGAAQYAAMIEKFKKEGNSNVQQQAKPEAHMDAG